ncbi:NmrA family NAD(P)-binding protein [Nocardiopsis sp. ARC36]
MADESTARITVLGATGGTGRQVVEQALAAGHRVTALVHPQGSSPFHRFVLSPLVGLVFRDAYRDLERMEAALSAGGAAWTVVRPPAGGPAPGDR